jgi:hypothetical protein
VNTLSEKWEYFKRDCIPKNAGAIQLREMKIAFYAGAFSFLQMQKNIIGDPTTSEDASLALLESWSSEIQDYFKEYEHC